MKARTLHTVPDVIVTDYTITQLLNGKFLHRFHPATTATIYEFEANATPRLKEGTRYNIGYVVDQTGKKIVEPSTLTHPVIHKYWGDGRESTSISKIA